MRLKTSRLRSFISALVAVVFAIAAEPGVMAMPAPKPVDQVMTMSMDGASGAGCDHMKPHKQQQAPCKNMAVCVGMLSCFGMAAVAVEQVHFHAVSGDSSAPVSVHRVFGRTLQPDNPPPII